MLWTLMLTKRFAKKTKLYLARSNKTAALLRGCRFFGVPFSTADLLFLQYQLIEIHIHQLTLAIFFLKNRMNRQQGFLT